MSEFFVPGKPVQQGSMKHIGNGMIVHNKSKELMAWREKIGWSAKSHRVPYQESGAVAIKLGFVFELPKSVKRDLPTVPPDLDKLIRSCLDALSGIAYKDDSQVCEILASKRYGETPGVFISLWSLTSM